MPDVLLLRWQGDSTKVGVEIIFDAVLTGSALALVGFAVITVGLWLKARVEEQFLSEELGAAVYGAYKARVPMLLPLVSRRSQAE